ncbi:DUF523 domain-containing protein [Desulfotalea psychrophila]|uniref:DUF523 domain-containing protein n=1 Tax=Desulfotalea psychrophila (strain LSv54 / DSM 12343) TaxID=177439 RepID=Q6AMD4_DESPS|nr:DUF523 domain-containing protein [Desulfotalea psychrophila]CAG36491.1 conserved hypothetical protein [Desulfotalea psychrophila LSv54]
MKTYLISACLVGLCTRYDNQCKKSAACMELLQDAIWIPVCPEQLGGLATPRSRADIVGGDGSDVLAGKAQVLTATGVDITEAFIKGAYQVLSILQQQNIDGIFFKAKSPSCGVVKKLGVTAALLQQHGYQPQEF